MQVITGGGATQHMPKGHTGHPSSTRSAHRAPQQDSVRDRRAWVLAGTPAGMLHVPFGLSGCIAIYSLFSLGQCPTTSQGWPAGDGLTPPCDRPASDRCGQQSPMPRRFFCQSVGIGDQPKSKRPDIAPWTFGSSRAQDEPGLDGFSNGRPDIAPWTPGPRWALVPAGLPWAMPIGHGSDSTQAPGSGASWASGSRGNQLKRESGSFPGSDPGQAGQRCRAPLRA